MNNHTKASMVVVGFLLALAASTASAQNNVRSLQSLRVVDANGKVVGKVLGFVGDGIQNPVSNVVAFSLQKNDSDRFPEPDRDHAERKNVITLGVVTNGFIGSDNILWFTSFDCSGAPWFTPTPTGQVSPLPDTASRTGIVNGKVFSTTSSTPQTVNPNSIQIFSNSPGNAECFQDSQVDFPALPSQLVIDLGAHYSAPFKVVGTLGQDEDD
jgi:hypothetical protein